MGKGCGAQSAKNRMEVPSPLKDTSARFTATRLENVMSVRKHFPTLTFETNTKENFTVKNGSTVHPVKNRLEGLAVLNYTYLKSTTNISDQELKLCEE